MVQRGDLSHQNSYILQIRKLWTESTGLAFYSRYFHSKCSALFFLPCWYIQHTEHISAIEQLNLKFVLSRILFYFFKFNHVRSLDMVVTNCMSVAVQSLFSLCVCHVFFIYLAYVFMPVCQVVVQFPIRNNTLQTSSNNIWEEISFLTVVPFISGFAFFRLIYQW